MKETLTKRRYIEYNRISRYSAFPIYYHRIDNKWVYGITSQLDTSTEVPYSNHVVELGDTLDNLALYYYNNPTYFWVIADYNRIQDPYEDLIVGSTIKIPSMSNIQYDFTKG